MKYMLLINQGEAMEQWGSLTAEEQKQIAADYQAINQTPGVTPGVHMESPEMATVVRIKKGETVTTDGPFAETKEALGGYLHYECEDLDAAIALAARIPALRFGGAVEIRPLVEYRG